MAVDCYGAVPVVAREAHYERAVKAPLVLGYKISVQEGMDATLLWNNIIHTHFFTVLPFE